MSAKKEIISITIDDLSIENINYILQSGAEIKISENAIAKIKKCRSYLDEKMA